MNSNKKYNIMILNHHASSPDVGGGGRHYEIGKLLSENGHKVTIIASSYAQGKKVYRFPQEIVMKKLNDDFSFVWLKTKPAYKNTFTRFINYIDYMRKASKFHTFEEPPNVIIASSVHPLAWVAGYELSQKYNAKFIVEVRDLWPLSMYEDFDGFIRDVVFKFFERLEEKYYNLASSIITTAPFAYEYMEEMYGIDKEKVVHIPHGIDIDKFDENIQQSDDILDQELNNVLNNYFCITYTGSLSKSEGLDTFVKAARYLKEYEDIRIVIVGNGKEKENLIEIINKESLTNVIMFDRIERDSVPLVLKKSDILLCGLMERKAFDYGISKNKFYDYMAAEKPIIFASNVRGSLIDEAKAGITIRPNDPRKLSESILYLYNNMGTLGKEYGENGRKYVEKYHTTEKVAQDFMKVITSN
ncbi:MAG TPA: glycosyltransferase family 4 protein [Tissierellales bacterium]|nr:glycosyltransferase family 4 protein [Tissierellales bacterium]